MAKILSIEKVQDGWQVEVELVTGAKKSWHYLKEPTQTMIDATEIRLMIARIEEYYANAD